MSDESQEQEEVVAVEEVAEEIRPQADFIGSTAYAYVFDKTNKEFFKLTLDVDLDSGTARVTDTKSVSKGIAKHLAVRDAQETLVNHIMNINTL